MNRNINVVVPIPNDFWSGKDQVCLLAVCGTNILSAVCIEEPAKGRSYEEEILRVSHTNMLDGDTVIIGEFTGKQFRDKYTNKHWEQLEENGLDREYLVESLNPYR